MVSPVIHHVRDEFPDGVTPGVASPAAHCHQRSLRPFVFDDVKAMVLGRNEGRRRTLFQTRQPGAVGGGEVAIEFAVRER